MSYGGRFAVVISLALAACGGGGGDGASPPAASTAEGVYGGTLTGSASSRFQMLILENGEFWALYGDQSANLFRVAGFIQGQGTSSGGAFTASDVRDFGFAPPLVGTASATYNSSTKTIAGTVSASGGSVGFSGGPIPGSLYNYDSPAVLSAVSGSWTLTSLTGEGIALVVAGNGSFTAISQYGCAFAGSITPRASGKNVFNVQLTFGNAPCLLPNQTATGIIVAYPLATGQTQMIFAGTNSSRTVGTAAFGAR